MKILAVSPTIHKLSKAISKIVADEELPTEPTADPAMSTDPATDPAMSAPEEKDQDTLLQEHVKTNIDKYRLAFETLFPKAQMVAKNVEYHGAVVKDKIRVTVEFETPMLNFDALQVMSDKEIGIEATGENTFKVYNIFLPKMKDATIEKK